MKIKKTALSIIFANHILIFQSIPAHSTTLTLAIDNDGPLVMDREYTSGIFIRLANKPNFYGYSIELGSQMWTPKNIKLFSPQPNERPYAGLLYLQGRLHYQLTDLALKFNAMLGAVGPKSRAKTLQTYGHKVIGSPVPNGWDNQIRDENIFQVGVETQHLLLRSANNHSDLSIVSRGQAGNFQNEIAIGATVRLGRDLKNNFGSTSLSINNNIDTDLLEGSAGDLVFYTMAEARYRFSDITIEGYKPTVFNHLTVRHKQISVSSGIIYYGKHWGASTSGIWQSKLYNATHAKAHSYMNLTFFYRF